MTSKSELIRCAVQIESGLTSFSIREKLIQSSSKYEHFLTGKTFQINFFNENRSIHSTEKFSQGKAI